MRKPRVTKQKKANNRRPDSVPRKALADAIRYRANEVGLNRELLGARVKDAASQMSRLMTGYDGDFSIDLSKANGRAEVTIYYTGPVSRSSAYDYVVSLDPTGTMLSRPVCSVRAPETSVADARRPVAKCGWCNADMEHVAAFCSDECESAYSNTASDHCDICNEYEDECVCAGDEEDDVCQTAGCGRRSQHDMEVVCMVEECECPGFTTEPAEATNAS